MNRIGDLGGHRALGWPTIATAMVAVVYLVGLFRDDYFSSLRHVIVACGFAGAMYFAYTLCDSMAESADRFQACAFAAAAIFGGLCAGRTLFVGTAVEAIPISDRDRG